MPIVDIVIVLATLTSVIVGWFRGLVREAISIASLLIAIWAAMHLGPYAGGWLGGTIDSSEVQMWAGRFLVFVVVLAVGAFLGWGISKIIHMAGLSKTDRTLGGFFGLLRAALLAGVFVLAGKYVGFDADPWWLESKVIPYAEHIADWIIEMAPRGVEMLQPENLPDEFRL
jgi:membrane protein required for colicin V production